MGLIVELIGRDVIHASCGCDKGNVRENNEDNFYFGGDILSSDNKGLQKIISGSFRQDEYDVIGDLFAVFDGMGGTQYGEYASHDAADCTARFMKDPDNFNPSDVTPTLTRLCMDINERVFESGRNLGASVMGTTMAALYFFNGMVWSCNIGDSRCYRFRDGSLELLSEDHVEDMFDPDREKRKRKPGLIQYLGMDPDEIRLDPTIVSSETKEGDIYLICSDGLTDMVTEPDISAVLSRNKRTDIAVRELIDVAIENGGRDNVTVIVCRC